MRKKKKERVEKKYTDDGQYFYLSNKPDVLFPAEFEKILLPNVSKTKFESTEKFGKVLFIDPKHYTYEKTRNITYTFYAPFDKTRAIKKERQIGIEDFRAYQAKKGRTATLVPIVIILILSIPCNGLIGGILGYAYLSFITLPITYAIIAFLHWLDDKEFERRQDIEISKRYRSDYMKGMIGSGMLTNFFRDKK